MFVHLAALRKGDPSIRRPGAADLRNDPLVRWQACYFLPLAVFMSFLLPLGLGFWFGDPWGFLVLAGFLRLVLVLHATFSINSVTHTIGRQPYSETNSSRDSLLAALVTMGEGYHNYHHTFPSDYRNGVGRHQFDPTKWIVRALVPLGITWNLKRTSLTKIYRALMQVDEERLRRQGRAARLNADEATATRRQFNEWVDFWNALRADLGQVSADIDVAANKRIRLVRRQLRAAAREIKGTYAAWGKVLASAPAAAQPA